MSFQPYLKGVPLLVLLWTGLTSGAAQIGPQSAAGDPLRQLERSVRSDHVSGQNHIPLWGGPDDDPTLAADYFPDQPPASAQKAASRAEHFSKKQKHDKAIEEYEKALRIDPSYYEADSNLALEFFSAGKPDLAIKTLRNLTEYNPKRVLARQLGDQSVTPASLRRGRSRSEPRR